MVAQNCALALCFLSHAHPVVVQIAKCQAKLFGSHFNEFQGPNRFFRGIRALRVSPYNEEKTAEKEVANMRTFMAVPPRLFRRSPTAKGFLARGRKEVNRLRLKSAGKSAALQKIGVILGACDGSAYAVECARLMN